MSFFHRVDLERNASTTSGPSTSTPGFRRFVRRILLVALIAPTLFAGSFARSAVAEEFEGYVKSTALNVRSGPGSQSDVAGILLKYDPVTVTGERNVGSTRWFSIKASGGYVTGWVAARFIQRGEAPPSTSEAPIDYGAKETPTLMRGDFKYVGVAACAECHDESTGAFDQGAVPVWESHFHSQAHKTLQRDYTKTIASRTRGVDDPANDWRCVKCHQTAFGASPDQIAPSYRPEQGVGCEVCHGPGSVYAEEDHGPDVANREAMGFRVLRDLSDRREVCTSCHNRASPTFIGFDLREFSRKIAHWVDKDDAAYYAEYDKEADRRAKSITEPKKATKKEASAAGVVAGAAGTAGAAGASSAADAGASASKAAAEAARTAEAAKAASEAEASRAASKAAEAARAAEAKKAEAARKADSAANQARDRAAKEKAAKEKAARDEAKRAKEAAARKKAEAEAAARAESRKREEAARAAAAETERKAKKAKSAASAATAAAASPLAHYLDDVDDKIVMNTDGKKYKRARFNHRKHATGEYWGDMTCQTCHHTQEGDESPESCNECHDIGGDADEEKAKKGYVHTKGMAYPMDPDQEQVSCVSCHKAMNTLLDSGQRDGKKAPVKCTHCHKRNK